MFVEVTASQSSVVFLETVYFSSSSNMPTIGAKFNVCDCLVEFTVSYTGSEQ